MKIKTYCKCLIFLFILIICSSVTYATPPSISDVADNPDPIKWNDGNISINASVTDINTNWDTVLLQILDSDGNVTENITMNLLYVIDSDTKKYGAHYNPSEIKEYHYRVWANDTAGESSNSSIYTFTARVYPYVSDVTDSPDPIKYDAGNITIQADVIKWDFDFDTAVLEILSPVTENITMEKIASNTYEGKYDPETKTTYTYRIFINDTSGNASTSDTYSFISEGYPPVITNVEQIPPGLVNIGQNYSFRANVTTPQGSVDTVLFEITSPIQRSFEMQNISQDIYEYNYTIEESGYNFYSIWANNTEEDVAVSDSHYFTTAYRTHDNISIYVSVAPSCSGTFDYYYVPEPPQIIQNQTVFWLSMYSNNGNIAYNVTNNQIIIRKYNITPEEESLIVFNGTDIVAYFRQDDSFMLGAPGTLEPQGSLVFWAIWSTQSYPIGNYSVTYNVTYSGVLVENGGVFNCSDEVTISADFEIVNIMGGDEEGGEEPEPTPTPTPVTVTETETEPEPEPESGSGETPGETQVKISIVPINTSVDAYQGQTIPVLFNITNIGKVPVSNITLDPLIYPGWEFSEVLIDYIQVNETLTRTMLVIPSVTTPPGVYAVPIKAMKKNSVLDLAYFWMTVLFGEHLAKMQILESPTILEVDELSNVTLPILLKNIGEKELHEISIRLENVENCISKQYNSQYNLTLNETKPIDVYIKTKEGPQTCKGTLIISSAENAYAFAPIKIIVRPSPPFILPRYLITPLLALFWTLLLIIYTVLRKRKLMMLKEKDKKENIMSRLIMYFLILGEIVILVYVLSWLFGLLQTVI